MIGLVILLGAVQALTEFLPVSSSAHLLIIPWLIGVPNPGLAFDAALHIGTSIALIWYFWADFKQIVQERGKLLWLILIASIPGGAVGFLGEKVIDSIFHEGSAAITIAAVGMLIATGIIWWIDQTAQQKRSIDDLSRRDAILIGVGQALALIPGVSRSGSTIAAGLLTGLKRDQAARFSFLIGTPIALGAGLYKFLGLLNSQPSVGEVVNMGLGIMVSAGLGFVVIRWLLKYLQSHDLKVFLMYRIGFAVLVLLLVWIR
ncbi:MAG: undecaprenyl-diphosphate phosphatase [bacterium]